MVALVRDAVERIGQAERVHDLGRRRQQRDDLHARTSSLGSDPSSKGLSRKGRAGRRGRGRPAAPSIRRWSNVSDSVAAGRATTAPSTTSARGSITPSARMAACGGLMIGVPELRAERPHVGDRDRAAGHVRRARWSRPGRPRPAGRCRRRLHDPLGARRRGPPGPAGRVRCRWPRPRARAGSTRISERSASNDAFSRADASGRPRPARARRSGAG